MTLKAKREAAAQRRLDAKILEFVADRKTKGQSEDEIAAALFQRMGYLIKRITQTQIVLRGVKGTDWIIEMPKQNPKKSKKAAKKRNASSRASSHQEVRTKELVAKGGRVYKYYFVSQGLSSLSLSSYPTRAEALKAGRAALKARKPNGKTVIKAKRVTILNLKKNPSFAIHKTLKPTKRGNQAGWLLGKKFYAKARGQKALPGNSILDLNSGLVYQRVANPKNGFDTPCGYCGGPGGIARGGGHSIECPRYVKPKRKVKTIGRKKKNIAGFMQDGVFHPIRSGVEQRTVKGKTRLVKSKKAYKPSKVGEKATYSRKKSAKRAAQSKRMAAATKQRKATTSRLASRSLQRSVPLKKTRRNPDTPAQLLNEFRGYPKDKDSTLYFAEGTPTGLYKLGSLYQIKLVNGTKIKPTAGKVWLCADTKGKLYLGTTDSKQVLAHAPQGSLGKVAQVEYQARKPHLGDNQITRYYHNLGEETGEKPTLYSDGKGGLLFKGGATYIRSDGIHN